MSSLNLTGAAEPEEYKPSVQDVLDVKTIIVEASQLPPEMIDIIIDYAEYWPHTSVTTTQSSLATGSRLHENVFIIRSYPLGYAPTPTAPISGDFFEGYMAFIPPAQSSIHDNPKTLTSRSLSPSDSEYQSQPTPEITPASQAIPLTQSPETSDLLSIWTSNSLPRGDHPCRKIVFTINSHDQGWGGTPAAKGTYRESFTWFDAGIERVEAASASTSTISAGEAPPAADTSSLSSSFNSTATHTLTTHNPDHISPSACVLISDPPGGICKTGISSTPHTAPESADDKSSPPEILLRPVLPPAKPSSDNTTLEFEHPFLPDSHMLQSNLTATRDSTTHTITWHSNDSISPESQEGEDLEDQGRGKASGDGTFVRGLNVGDCVTVWARARFPGWANIVESVGVDVYWAV